MDFSSRKYNFIPFIEIKWKLTNHQSFQHGCPSCGFSFCSKCLKHSVIIPKLGAEKKGKVCQPCFDKISQKQDEPEQIIPPERFLKYFFHKTFIPFYTTNTTFRRMEELEKQNPKTNPKDASSSSSSDNEIAEKLKSLRGEAKIASSNEFDIAQRLAGLRGVEYKEYSKKQLINSRDNRSDQEKINDLLNQYGEENTINEAVGETSDPIKDIENRLSKLREGRSSSTKITKPEEYEESDDEETIAKKMVEKVKTKNFIKSYITKFDSSSWLKPPYPAILLNQKRKNFLKAFQNLQKKHLKNCLGVQFVMKMQFFDVSLVIMNYSANYALRKFMTVMKIMQIIKLYRIKQKNKIKHFFSKFCAIFNY